MIPKFRAWHKEQKRMLEVEILNMLEKQIWRYDGRDLVEWYEFKNLELMQWTGLQDKDGVDIYEGDIVNDRMDTISGSKNQYGIIRFGEHETSDDYYASTAYGFYIEYVNNPSGSTVNALDGNTQKDIILIGNIYENSDLLEQK